jgi:YebC/PmpR family DNA-binding regulatory protein
MSGHSKWATIKRKKGATDAKRGRVFTKLIKEITIAARGGADVNNNPRLRSAVAAAKAASMPGDNIDRAIKKGSGELGGGVLEEITYEAFGPGGLAILIEAVTDNKNRTVGEIRSILTKANGKLGSANSVAIKFERKGVIPIPAAKGLTEDKLMEDLLELGVEDYKNEDGNFIVYTDANTFESVRGSLEAKKYTMEEPGIQMIPRETVPVESDKVEAVLKLIDKLEDNDDVQNVYANYEISAEDLEKYS